MRYLDGSSVSVFRPRRGSRMYSRKPTVVELVGVFL